MKDYIKIWFIATVLAVTALALTARIQWPARAAGPWYVGPGGSDGSTCLSPATRCASINGALNKPGFVAGDTIRVQVGTYTGSGNEVVLLDKGTTLSGGWDATFTTQSGVSTIDGQGARRGITVNSGVTATVERFVVRNGMRHIGGGISNEGALTLNDSSINDNTAECSYSALYNTGTFTSNNCAISGNAVTVNVYCVGWAVMNESSGIMTLNSTTISDNLGSGGIFNYGTLALNSSIVSGHTNTRGDGGGGIGNSGTLTLNSSTVSNNTAENGGGIFQTGGTVALNNSTVSGNTASQGSGGGIVVGWFASSGNLSINNSTVSGNTATTGGGISNGFGTVTLQNSILAGNVGGNGSDFSGNIGSAGYNLIGNISGCTFTPNTGDLTNTNPHLGPLEGLPGYYPLFPSSPAINGGNPGGCTGSTGPLTTDQRGRPRFGRCDIGAYEAQPIAFSTKTANQATASFGDAVTYTITLNNGGSTNLTTVHVTDTLPPFLRYINSSLSATSGSYSFNSGTINWNGDVNTGGSVAITFGAIVEPTIGSIVNAAVITGGGETITRTATVNIQEQGQLCNLTKAPGNPVLSIGPNGAWDDDDVWRPTVLKEVSGYKLWYVADDGSNPSRIGLATSNNGLNWTKYGGNPVLSPGGGWETGGLSGSSVIFDSGQYKMWYTGFDSSGVGHIGYATSPDGINWTKHGGNPVLSPGGGGWEDADVMFPSVLKLGSTYHMWYEGHDGSTHRLGHATSGDGLNWTKDGANPVLDVGPAGAWDWLSAYGPNVIQYNNTFILWYSGQTLPEAWQTGYALSTNGTNWTRQKLLIPEGPAGAFDNASADYAAVIADGTDFKVWYSGYNGAAYTIGYATAKVCSAAAPAPSSSPIYLPVVLKAWNSQYPCPAYYTDNFSDPGSGWPISDNSARRYAYVGGQYQIWVKNPNKGWSATPGAKATDFTASVSARRASGTTGGYGIIFGINEDWSQWYEFDIGVNNYSIWKYDNGYAPALRNWTYSPAVATGTNWNRLKVVRQDSSISVYVNNQLLSTVTDGSFTDFRRIGLTAGSGSVSNDVRFDNFSLYPASCGVGAAEIDFEMGQPEIHEVPLTFDLYESP